jgi:hypothetical protein
MNLHAAKGTLTVLVENMKVMGYNPCGSEVDHQILKGSVKRFKSYQDFKNPR